MDEQTGGRPWPAPGPGVEWWRGEATPHEPDQAATPEPGAGGDSAAAEAARPAEGEPSPSEPAESAGSAQSESSQSETAESAEGAQSESPQSETAESAKGAQSETPQSEPAVSAQSESTGGEPSPSGPPRPRQAPRPDAGQPEPVAASPREIISPYATAPRVTAAEQPVRPLPQPTVTLPPTVPVPVPAGALREPAAGVAAVAPAVAAAPGRELVPAPRPAPVPPAALAQPAPMPGRRARRRPARLRRPWVGLPALVVLTLAASFFAWVSAEPFWLALGRGQTGTATVRDAADGCRVEVATAVSSVELLGVDAAQCVPGASFDVRMLHADSARAYATDTPGLHLRWTLGLFLVLLCGLAIAWLTGATSFAGWRFAAAVGLSLAGPALIAMALIAATGAR